MGPPPDPVANAHHELMPNQQLTALGIGATLKQPVAPFTPGHPASMNDVQLVYDRVCLGVWLPKCGRTGQASNPGDFGLWALDTLARVYLFG